ncbi:MAG: type II toxin-antitoxin system VapC family toxin [Bacillota bacterium]|nr:type II toxin-antitoxin system VapC family toxin [Bacillota bacterium]
MCVTKGFEKSCAFFFLCHLYHLPCRYYYIHHIEGCQYVFYGATKSKKKEGNTTRVEQFLLPFEVIPFDNGAAELYAGIRVSLAEKGTPIGPNDLIVASTVMANKGTLITNSEQEFRRIKDLQIENWTAG